MAYKPRIESNNLDLTSILSTINELPEAGGGVEINVITAASLPATVVENQIVVITDTTPSTIYVDTDEPANPVNGDVWVQVGSSDYGVEFSETFRNGLNRAKQYIGSSWISLSGYIGVSGAWGQFSTPIPAPGTPLADWTWAELVELANNDEDPTNYFATGDTKDLVLSTGEAIVYVLGDFYHNTITGTSRKAKLAFTPHPDCLDTKYQMNNSATNVGSWGGSKMCNEYVPNILATFPAELRAENAMKYVDVVTSAGGTSTTLVTTSDRLRPHSLTELGLLYDGAASGEGAVYPYYAGGNRIKYINDNAVIYWTRSPNTASSAYFCNVSVAGAAARLGAANEAGVALAFDL